MRGFLKILFIFTATIAVAAEQIKPSATCNEFRFRGWPDSSKLARYALHNSLNIGARDDSLDHFYNIDIDGDDRQDVITTGCSASIIRADPCMMDIKLSSGGTIEFEAWYLYLVRHHGRIYAVTADERGSNNKIYHVGPTAMQLVCTLE